jgi:hypothetical protein
LADLTDFAVVLCDSDKHTVTLTTSAGSSTVGLEDGIWSVTLLNFVTAIFSTDQGIAITHTFHRPESPANLTSLHVDPAGGDSFFGLNAESHQPLHVRNLGRPDQSVVEIRRDVDHDSVSSSFYLTNSIVNSRSDGSAVFDVSSLAGEKFIDNTSRYAFEDAEFCVIVSLTTSDHASRSVNGVQLVPMV